MKKVELLSPAGSIDSLYASVQGGTDAVYIGGNKFSARAYAENFDEEIMENAVDYCHIYGVKIYVTVNTLIKECEISEATEYVIKLYKMGVDALIIQDLGLYNIIKQILPDFEMHASTQMTVHNGEAAILLTECGFKRIVLSREMEINEIKYISKELNIDTEVFIHGALCVCYSGQCLMSSMIGGRSGNRGRCAQPCRMPYTIIDKKSNKEKSGYLLSPKDICTIEELNDIIDTGTSSLKIEGRMKRPQYVSGVVMSYRKAIDRKYGDINGTFDSSLEKNRLLQLFNREGFSKGYFYGNKGKEMMAYNYPKNTGIEIGKVNSEGSVLLKENVSVQDGIRNGESGFTINKLSIDGENVEFAEKGNLVRIFPTNYRIGDYLYKTSNFKMLKDLEAVYSNPYLRKIELELCVSFIPNQPIKLFVNFQDKCFTIIGDMVQKALKKPLLKEKIEENLKKSYDTPIKFKNITFLDYEEGFLPISSINNSRREIINSIDSYIKNKYKRDYKKNDFIFKPNISSTENSSLSKVHKVLVCVNNKEQYRAVVESGLSDIAVNLFIKNSDIDFEKLNNKKVYLKIPNIIRKEFEYVCELINKNIEKIEGIVTGNLGIIHRFMGKTKIIGDYKLNIFNSSSLEFYKEFIDETCLSVELNKKEIKDIALNTNIPLQVMCYGKVELMVSEYCAIGSVFGGRSLEKVCSNACTDGEYYLKDRKDAEFLITNDRFCRSYIYNSVPLNLIDNINELENINIKQFRMDFIDENYEETLEVIKSFKNRKWEMPFDNYTRGHYKRGVE